MRSSCTHGELVYNLSKTDFLPSVPRGPAMGLDPNSSLMKWFFIFLSLSSEMSQLEQKMEDELEKLRAKQLRRGAVTLDPRLISGPQDEVL